MPITLSQRPSLSVGATRLVRVDFTDVLDEGALLTGTPTVVEIDTSALTLGNKTVSTESYTDKAGSTVEIGKAVQFTVSGGVDDTTYRVRITVGTDSTPAETLPYDVLLSWE